MPVIPNTVKIYPIDHIYDWWLDWTEMLSATPRTTERYVRRLEDKADIFNELWPDSLPFLRSPSIDVVMVYVSMRWSVSELAAKSIFLSYPIAFVLLSSGIQRMRGPKAP